MAETGAWPGDVPARIRYRLGRGLSTAGRDVSAAPGGVATTSGRAAEECRASESRGFALLRDADGTALELVHDQDGADLPHMRNWHTVSFDE